VPWSLTGSAGRVSERRRAFLVAVVVAGLIGFGALALAYSHNPVARYDQGVARWVADDLPSWVQSSARPFSWLGGWIGFTILGVVAFAVLVRERAWLDLGFFLATFLGVQLVVALLKDTLDRSRADVGSAVPLLTSPAFRADTRPLGRQASGRSPSSPPNGCPRGELAYGSGRSPCASDSRSASRGSRSTSTT
jgi:hypothetical protein